MRKWKLLPRNFGLLNSRFILNFPNFAVTAWWWQLFDAPTQNSTLYNSTNKVIKQALSQLSTVPFPT
jgi:hypothetical protein